MAEQQPAPGPGRRRYVPQHASGEWPIAASSSPTTPQAETAPRVGITPMMRGRALERAIQVNASHARNAADRIGTRDALGEHALVLFSADETSQPVRLSTATRLDYEEHGGEDLPAMLKGLARHANQRIQAARRSGRRWDPRTPLDGLVLRSEPVTPSTGYIGLAISTLDMPTMSWHEAKRAVTSADGLNLSGQGYLYLSDGTAMYFLRAAQMSGTHGQHTIVTNRVVHSTYRPRIDNDLLTGAPVESAAIWEGIEQLNAVLAGA